MTSPHGKGVRKQHFFSIDQSSCPSHYFLNHWVEFHQSCYMASPHGKGVQEASLSICHAVSTISMEHWDFAMACHQLHILVFPFNFSHDDSLPKAPNNEMRNKQWQDAVAQLHLGDNCIQICHLGR